MHAAERHVVVEPDRITDLLAAIDPGGDVACSPPARPGSCARPQPLPLAAGLPCQVALEAPMACGYGSCHGCAVRLDGRLVRLCLEGPVVDARRMEPVA